MHRVKFRGVFGSLMDTVMEHRTIVEKVRVPLGSEDPPKQRQY